MVAQDTVYVSQKSSNPRAPFASWDTAATNIQDAVDVAKGGDTVLVGDGVYATGGRREGNTAVTNRVVVDLPVILRSVNGPRFTLIEGAKGADGGAGVGAVRCVRLADGASLSGFTLTNGAAGEGGGVLCVSANSTLTNCVLTHNSAGSGGGARGGTLDNCVLEHNSASEGGGARGAILRHCLLTGNTANDGGGAFESSLIACTLSDNVSTTYGGGASLSELRNCIVRRNSAKWGGGADGGTLYGCTLAENSASHLGGGASAAVDGEYQGSLYNCTVTGNSASESGRGGGTYGVWVYNSIVYHNDAGSDPNWAGGRFAHSCSTPLPSGAGNIAEDPQLTADFHLLPTSPCIGAGSSSYADGVDIDGQPWADPPPMGAAQRIHQFASLVLVGSWRDPDSNAVQCVAPVDNRVYLATAQPKLQVLEREAGGSLVSRGSRPSVLSVSDLAVSGSTLFVVSAAPEVLTSVEWIDFTDPASPVSGGYYDTHGDVQALDVRGGHLFLAAGDAGLQIVELAGQPFPTLTASYVTPGRTVAVQTVEDLAYVALSKGLIALDISDPNRPERVGAFHLGVEIMRLQIHDGLGYVLDGEDGLHIIDLNDPGRITQRATVRLPALARALAVAYPYVYLATGQRSLQVLDVTRPDATKWLAGYVATAPIEDMAVVENRVYLACGAEGLLVLEFLDQRLALASSPSEPKALTLSWQAGAGWHLQQSSELQGSDWTDVPGSERTNRISLPKTGSKGLFRLMHVP